MKTLKPILAGIGIFILISVLLSIAQILYMQMYFRAMSVEDIKAGDLLKPNPFWSALRFLGILKYFIAGFVTAKLSLDNKLRNSALVGVTMAIIGLVLTVGIYLTLINTQVRDAESRMQVEMVHPLRSQYNEIINRTIRNTPLTMVKSGLYTLIGGGIYFLLSKNQTKKEVKKKVKTN